MEGKRITLDFSETVYQNEWRIWYFLNYEQTATIKDVVLDLTRNLNCGKEWNVYINDIICPDWVSTHVIASDQDSVKLIRSGSSNKKVILPKDGIDQHEQSITVVDNHHTILTTVDKKDIPLANPSLKINNNFKRKFSSTTPTSRDRYTNRSKIYVSPVLPKCSKSSIPVVTALKTAVKETLNFSSPIRTMPSNMFSCQTATVTDSQNKARIFEDKVTTLLNKSKPAVKIDSDSSSSEDEDVEKPSKVAKVSVENIPTPMVSKKPIPSSSESESEPEIMVKKTDMKVLKKPIPSSSESDSEIESVVKKSDMKISSSESDSEPEIMVKKTDTKILKKPIPSSSESESEPEIMAKKTDMKVLKKPIPSSSDSESEIESVVKKSDMKILSSDSDSEPETMVEKIDTKILRKPISSSESAMSVCIQSEKESSDEEVEDKKVTSTLVDELSKTGNQSKENGHVKSLSDLDNENKAAASQDTSESGNKDYSSFIGLQGAPRVSDRVAFKMLDLNDSYCPIISEYKEGVVTGYDSHSQSIILKLLPPFNTLKRKPGKFELDDSLCTSNSLELNLKQLIEPKLLP